MYSRKPRTPSINTIFTTNSENIKTLFEYFVEIFQESEPNNTIK